jgi:hypothetical protein
MEGRFDIWKKTYGIYIENSKENFVCWIRQGDGNM